jgi:hypothetical protein
MRRQLTMVGSILLGCLIVGLLFGRVTVSQVAPPPGQQVGRYQMSVGVDSGPGGGRTVVVCDTATGQCWVDASGGRGKTSWRDLGSPSEKNAD